MKNFMGNMGYRFQNWMRGRYGGDEFSRFLGIAAIVFIIPSFFARFCPPLYAFYFLALATLAYDIYRTFSKNIYARTKERDLYYRVKRAVTGFFRLWILRFKEGKTSRFYRCSSCHATVRVPKGKGRIQITCPKCRNQFIKRT